MQELNKILSSLTPEKRALLEKKLKSDPQKYNLFPLSFAQQRLWFLDQLDPGNTSYNIPAAFKIIGDLDFEALTKSISAIIDRHEILRSKIIVICEEPMQFVSKESEFKINKYDLSELGNEERETAIRKRIDEEVNTSFEIADSILFKINIYKLSENEHLMLMLVHHIIFDGWSIGIFINEFSKNYEAFVNGAESQFDKLNIQYADFSNWQSKWINSKNYEKQLTYWRDKFSPLPPVLELNSDFPRSQIKRYEGNTYTKKLSSSYIGKISKLISEKNISEFMFFLSVFKVLISKYSSQNDITVGTPIANRNKKEIENLIGFFVNTLALRTELDENDTFLDITEKVKETTLDAFSNQDLPFENLVEELNPQRDMSHTPIFQLMFVYDSGSNGKLELTNLNIEHYPIEAKISKFDLTLSVSTHKDELTLNFEYDTNLFSESTVIRISSHLERVIKLVLDNPDEKLKDISILTEYEFNKLAYEWNDTRKSISYVQTLIDLFEQGVEENPNLAAVIYEDDKITYQELNTKANQLAHKLLKHNIGNNDIVGLHIDPSIEMIIGIIAILKVGAAYLPLDTKFPSERLRFMVSDSNISLLLYNQHLNQELNSFDLVKIDISSRSDIYSAMKCENPDIQFSPLNVAYLIFTSGSTGKPKAVACTHLGVINLVNSLNSHAILSEGFKQSLWTTLNFDVSVYEIFLSLLNCGELNIIPNEIRPDDSKLFLWLSDNKIESAYLPPFFLEEFGEWLDQRSNISYLKKLLVGVEPIKLKTLSKIKSLIGNIDITNGYGPTETTICSTAYKFKDISESEDITPIGGPLNNTKVYVLDNNLNVVPEGITGELYISSIGAAHGYLNRPDLTAEKFIPNPYSTSDGDRLYTTGDRVKYLSDGSLKFMGRNDNQVKIRGYRVELGEIENELNKLHEIKSAAVQTFEDKNGIKSLAAYLVTSNGSDDHFDRLRENIAKVLPDYMVPSYFIKLDKLPLLPNGKINRRLLPRPNENSISTLRNYIPATTNTEIKLCKIIEELLNISNVGIADNFFDLGGHSLLATKCISRIRDTFKIDLSLQALFELKDIKSIANKIDNILEEKGTIESQSIKTASRGEFIPLSFAQERLWFLDKLDPENSVYNIPIALKIKGKLDIHKFNETLIEITKRHEILRTTIETSYGVGFQQIHPESKTILVEEDYSEYPDYEKVVKIHDRIKHEASLPFELNTLPLMRTVLLKIDNDEYVFILIMHHIISDGWSVGIFIKEFSSIYQTLSDNKSSALKPLNLQYADYSYWQREWLKGKELEKQLSYWKNQLAGIPLLIQLPTDYPRPAIQTFNGSIKKFHINKNLAIKLNKLSKEYDVTLFMILIAAFQILLHKYSGQNDICVGTTVANRNRTEIESLIGFFVNTIVIRGDLSGNPSFDTLLNNTKESAVNAFANQDLPFEKLIDALKIERNVSHSPLFQVMFTFQNLEVNEISLADISLEQIEIGSSTTKFDLNLTMFEEKDGLLIGAFEYNTDLFEEKTIEQIISSFENLLTNLSLNPSIGLKEISLLTNEQQDKIVNELNPGKEVIFENHFVHNSIEKIALSSPDNKAIIYNDSAVNYSELNIKSNQLAHKLKTLGVGPDIIVGVHLERSAELIISILGILKAGGAYLSIDTNYPKERLQYLIDDSNAQIVISNDSISAKIDTSKVNVISINFTELNEYSKSNVISQITEDNLAYVIYTSGSTGKPKGTLITHKGLSNYLSWCLNTYPVESNMGSIVHSTISFDATITSIFPSLIIGKSIVLVDESQGIEGLAGCLTKYRDFNLIKITPAHLELLSQQLNKSDLGSLTKSLIIGGENLTTDQISFWQENAPDTLLFNEYGPTETVVGSVVYEASSYSSKGSVPIGKALQNTQIYVLDENHTSVPNGVPGELYIGGYGVARGYLNRPELTAERFIPNPYAKNAGDRIYKTGDLVRVLNDGNLIYHGRLDDQVKIRGYRIELDEINSVINSFSSIKSAIVIVREDVLKIRKLVAYYIPEKNIDISVAEIKNYMAKTLPDYMIPSLFIAIDEFPLTFNGKIDRKALPIPKSDNIEKSTKYKKPQTANEITLAKAFQNALNIEKIGINDNFFELGGDSIIGIKAISLAKQDGLHITPVQLFQYQTIHELAAVAKSAQATRAAQGILSGPVVFTPIQKLFMESNYQNPDHWNQSVLLKVKRRLNKQLLSETTEILSDHHDILRLRIIEGSEPKQEIISDYHNKSFEFINLENESDSLKDKIELKCSESQKSLNLTNGPIFKIIYFDISATEGRILFVIHHMAVDGVSWRILLEDFQTIYSTLEQKLELVLPMKSTSFMEWAEALVEYGSSNSIGNEKQYWVERAKIYKTSLEPDFEEGLNTEDSVKIISNGLNEELTGKLLKDVNQKYNTKINDILLTSLMLSYEKWMSKRSLFLTLEGHGRNQISDDIDLSRSIGWFTSFYPVYLDLKKAISIEDALKNIKEQIRSIPNEGIGFGILKYLSNETGLKNKLSVFDNIGLTFNYLGQFDNNLNKESIFEIAVEYRGIERAPENHRQSMIDITAGIYSNRFRINFNYSTNMYKEETINNLSDLYIKYLKDIIEDCTMKESVSYTSSDFELSNLNDQKLSKVLSKLKNK